MNAVTRAHNDYLNHLMQKTGCCAALHGRHCPTGERLRRRYRVRYWAAFVLRGTDLADRQLRLKEVPADDLTRVQRLVLALFARRSRK